MNDGLVFDKSFFEGEEREGFFVEPMMKSAWAAHLEVLYRVDKICRENDITYFADWGTLLGTIRHKGYIPWDDDIDICMLQPDLERFLQVVENYQDEVICLGIHNEPEWREHAIKVVNTTSFTVNRNWIREYYGFPLTAGVDIFALNYVPRDKALEQKMMDAVRLVGKTRHLKEEMSEYSPTSKEYQKGERMLAEFLQEIKDTCHVTFSQENPTEQELVILGKEIAAMYQEKDADYVTAMHRLAWGQAYYIPKEYYAKTIRLPFENFMMPVPVGFDFILRRKYGDNYMTPVNVGGGHDYPFYGTLIRALSKMRGDKSEDETKEFVEKISVGYYHDFLNKKANPSVAYEKTYFDEETIDGILVPEDRKRIWAAQTEVLEEVKRICKKLDIRLFAIGDTLTEAVKYHDYGPDSEDLHLAMLRSDYVKFLNGFQTELDPWFNYGTIYSNEDHEDMRTYIITDAYRCDSDEYAKRFHGCLHIVGVDISVLDTVDNDASGDEVRKTLTEGLITTAQNVSSTPPYTAEELSITEEWKKMANIDIDTEKNLRHEYLKAADALGGAYRKDGEMVRMTADLQEGKNTLFQKCWFHDMIEVPFGNTTIPVPVGYEEMMYVC